MILVKALLVGLGLTAATVGIHAAGTTWWLRVLQGRTARWTHRVAAPTSFGALYATAIFLLLLHVIEVGVWAVAYLVLPEVKSLSTLEEAIYFSAVTYATLGFGDVVIVESWRLLSALQAMAGLLVFGWSTALLFAVVQEMWEANE